MKRILISMMIFAVLISACSSTTATEPEGIVVREEVQASSEGGEIAGGLSSPAQDTSVELEAPGAIQPSEKSEGVTPATETPSIDQTEATMTPYPTYAPYPTFTAYPALSLYFAHW